MKINVKDFLQVLIPVGKVIPRKHPKPILKNFLIKDKYLQATDLEVGVKYKMPENSVNGEALCLDASKIINIVKELDGEIEIIPKEKSIEIKADDCNFNLLLADIKEYPEIPEAEKEAEPIEDIKHALDIVKIAVSKESFNSRLTGVFFGENEIVATDGKRMIMYSIQTGIKSKPIVPVKFINQIKEDVGFEITKNAIYAKKDGYQIFGRLLEGDFPDYKKVIPEKFEFKVKFDVEELLMNLLRAGIMVDEGLPGVEFNFSKDKLILKAQSSETGKAEVEMKIDCNFEQKIVFNPALLTDFLRIVDVVEIDFFMNDENNAAMFETEDIKYLVMPMNI